MYKVYKHGQEVWYGDYMACFNYILQDQGQGINWALRYGGYELIQEGV